MSEISPHQFSDQAEEEDRTTRGRIRRLRGKLRNLLNGHSRTALRFQMAILLVDLAIIAFFIIQPVLRETPHFIVIDYTVAGLLVVDIAVRTFAARAPLRHMRKPFVLLDLAILVTLIFPYALANFGFLRILRLWALSRSGALWRPLRRHDLAEFEQTAQALTNLVTFLFLSTGFVYTFFFRQGAGFTGYLDALYFTVMSVTTTGYGDIVLEGPWGKATSIVIMLVGITLFFRLAQIIVRPNKVEFPCPECALQRHDYDAVHCKACGHMLKIPDDSD